MNAGDEIIRRYYRFYGQVQGVGFRYRALHAARSFGVTGYVRNRYDGSVEIEAEGTREQLERMILAVEQGRFIHIEDLEVRTIPVKRDRDFICLDDR